MIRWKRLVNMAVVHVRRHVDATNIELVFRYQNPQIGVDRVFNFERNLSETINSTINRIKNNIEKEHNKKKKNKKKAPKGEGETVQPTQPIPIEVDFLFERTESTTWTDLLANVQDDTFKESKLKICGHEFSIAYNYPYVSEITMPSLILAGFDCYPAKFDVEFTEREKCIFEWYKGLPVAKGRDDDIVWNKCDQEGFFYKVQADDVHHKLKVIFILLSTLFFYRSNRPF